MMYQNIYKKNNLTMENEVNYELKKDVDLLGRILGKVILEQNGTFYFDIIEKLRKLSKQTRKENRIIVYSKIDEMSDLLKNLTPAQTVIVTRAFSQFLNLVNIAETVYEKDASFTSDELSNVIKKINNAGTDLTDIKEAISNLNINLVLTAHPTEVKRRTLIQKFIKIAGLLHKRKVVDSFTKNEIDNELYAIITNIWLTDQIRRKRPTPFEEAKWGIAVIEEVLWHTVPWYLRRLDTVMQKSGMDKLDLTCTPIKIGSWMGGDRDGNPFVTAKMTEKVIVYSRREAIRLYLKDFRELGRQLSLNECSVEFKKLVGNSYEPYRYYLNEIFEKLSTTDKWLTSCMVQGFWISNPNIINDKDDLKGPLLKIYDSLISVGAISVANNTLLDVIRKVETFGLSLAPLDIRQESTRHTQVIARVCDYLNLPSYYSLSEEDKCNWLLSELNNKRPLVSSTCPFSEDEQEVIDTVLVIKKLPRDSFGAYVISMASKVSDILAVCLIQKMCGIIDYLRVVPLFETLSDLQAASRVLNDLFSIEWYREHCSSQQEVMIGYSDSGKDAGKLAASWGLYQAQEEMLNVAKANNINICFFHGRGGSVGRGGGPVNAALLSQPPGTVDGNMRVTEQGEVIQQKFGSKLAAKHNFLTYISSVLEATLLPPTAPKMNWRKLMDEASVISCEEYRKVVFSDQKFIQYFRTATPEQELGRLCIGSRPAKRKKGGGVETLRAIPWIFAWTQVRLLLPAWLGMEKAFKDIIESEEKYNLMKEMIESWPFFHSLMDSIDMVLAKADRKMSRFYDKLLSDMELQKYGEEIRNKLSIIKEVNLKIINDLNLGSERDLYRSSLHYRNPYIDPLNLCQVEMMSRLNNHCYSNDDERLSIEDGLMLSIAGIAAGLKNTG